MVLRLKETSFKSIAPLANPGQVKIGLSTLQNIILRTVYLVIIQKSTFASHLHWFSTSLGLLESYPYLISCCSRIDPEEAGQYQVSLLANFKQQWSQNTFLLLCIAVELKNELWLGAWIAHRTFLIDFVKSQIVFKPLICRNVLCSSGSCWYYILQANPKQLTRDSIEWFQCLTFSQNLEGQKYNKVSDVFLSY